jgi:hypothetical protein
MLRLEHDRRERGYFGWRLGKARLIVSIGYSQLFAFALPPFVFGFGAYALSRKFVPSITVATVAGVPAMFVIAHLTTGTSAGMARGIVGLSLLSALFSSFGAFSVRLLVRELGHAGAKRAAAAFVTGLLLGAGVILTLAWLALYWRLKDPGTTNLILCSLLAIVGVGAFTIAMKTDSIGGSAGGIAFAMGAPIFFFDTTGYVIAMYILTFLPITIAAAALGGAFGRWRRRHAEKYA